jgi:hypothetical protein
VAYNAFFDNIPYNACSGGGAVGTCAELSLDGVDGNIYLVELTEASAVDSGDPELLDVDGSRSDIGLHGGPNASWELPPELER